MVVAIELSTLIEEDDSDFKVVEVEVGIDRAKKARR